MFSDFEEFNEWIATRGYAGDDPDYEAGGPLPEVEDEEEDE